MKEMTMSEFSRIALSLGLKGGEYAFQKFYRFLYKHRVSFDIYLNDVRPISKYFGYNLSREELVVFYNIYIKNKIRVPLGEDLFKEWAVRTAIVLFEDGLNSDKSKGIEYEIKKDQVPIEIFKKYVETLCSLNYFRSDLVDGIIEHLDKEELALSLRYRVCESLKTKFGKPDLDVKVSPTIS